MNTDHIKQRLEEELARVEKAIKENIFTVSDEDPTATERDEVADKVEEIEEGRGENVALTARQEALEQALDKIAAGTYGVCEVGGEPIEEERLEADPAASTCIAHKDQKN